MKKFKTEQEQFWADSFGNDYIERNKSERLLAYNIYFFSKALKQAGKLNSCLEFGANIGMNLKAIKMLFPEIQLKGIEINLEASLISAAWLGQENVFNGSILDYEVPDKVELSLIKGVLIHIHPDMLPQVYNKLYASSTKYILVAEYYNPSPVSIAYRGHQDKLYKRDFAGEMLDTFSDLKLVDYGFSYRRDPAFPQDDVTWFLMEKNKV